MLLLLLVSADPQLGDRHSRGLLVFPSFSCPGNAPFFRAQNFEKFGCRTPGRARERPLEHFDLVKVTERSSLPAGEQEFAIRRRAAPGEIVPPPGPPVTSGGLGDAGPLARLRKWNAEPDQLNDPRGALFELRIPPCSAEVGRAATLSFDHRPPAQLTRSAPALATWPRPRVFDRSLFCSQLVGVLGEGAGVTIGGQELAIWDKRFLPRSLRPQVQPVVSGRLADACLPTSHRKRNAAPRGLNHLREAFVAELRLPPRSAEVGGAARLPLDYHRPAWLASRCAALAASRTLVDRTSLFCGHAPRIARVRPPVFRSKTARNTPPETHKKYPRPRAVRGPRIPYLPAKRSCNPASSLLTRPYGGARASHPGGRRFESA